MRVLHVLEALEGGTSRHVRSLVECQVAAGHETAVVIPPVRVWGQTDTSLPALMAELGVEVFPLKMHRFAPHPQNAVAALALARLMRRWKPTIVHTHSAAGGVVGRPPARLLGIPSVHTPNGLRFADVVNTRVGAAARAVEKAMSPFTSKVIATSPSEADVLRTAYPAGKVALVANGIEPGPPPPPLPERFKVVSVSRLTYQKAPEEIVRVLADLRRRRPDAEAVIVGYGEQEPEIRRLIAQLDPAITISTEPGVAAIASASVLLLASRFEGLPYVILEAMDLGRPVVASDVVGSRDTVVDGETGRLFPFGDAAAGGECLAALADDPGLARTMGLAGRARLEQHFTVAAMAEAVEAIYAAAIAQTWAN
jgi:glycosyltransferase involved in cell wall biosynthesis